MPELKNINLNGTLLEITDTTARTLAESAIDLATEAENSADNALSVANSKTSISYNEKEMIMYIK